MTGRRRALWSTALLAVLAYLPAFTSAPGRMPADSKLYLYLDPGRFLGDAASTFDPRQFAGWVPHQHVAYLWPTGPWYWLFDLLAVPDWIAHRLWLGTLLLAAGLGVRWCARLLGLGAAPALVAALAYQLSPYVLPYVSRTSVMLLPWAGLGWIVGSTVLATRRRTWLWPAVIALVVFTVGAVNATALAMIVPAPVLWLLHAAWGRFVPWRDAALVAVRTAALSAGVSLWWIAMLLIQGRHGADVLPYSEALRDVALTSTAPEVWRGLGYWLFYVRDAFTAATSESLRYLTSTPVIAVSFAVPIIALAGLTFTSWVHRRFAALLVATGLVLAVGVHPIDDRSPLMRLLTGSDEDGLALALRSSTRALPVAALGLALGTGALVAGVGGLLRGRRSTAARAALLVAGVGRLLRGRRSTAARAELLVAGVVAALVVANLPALWTGGFVDPYLERDQDPPDAWLAAARRLDERGVGGRVLQIPGAEFGAFTWGYTVDQPLPGLTDKPLVTRDLLPLGSPAAMDLLFALDDRIQEGTLDPEALAPIARLLGVDTVWVAADLDAERFRTASPDTVETLVAAAPGIGPAIAFGDPAAVVLHDVEQPGTVIRVGDATVVVSGSGDGLIDLAAAGLLSGHEVTRYSAALEADELAAALADAEALLVTDSNRDRAHHWRSSQDVVGFTESGGPEADVLRRATGDARLPVFPTADPSTQTVAIQRGAVTATASSYGEAFAHLPEHRPFAAVDGDLGTAWLVGEHGDPVGEHLRLTLHSPVDALALRQAPGPRRITHVTITPRSADGRAAGRPLRVMLDERSHTAEGQPVTVDATAGTVLDVAIDAVEGSPIAPVGFAEVAAGVEPTVEVVRPPHDALAALDPATPLAVVLTRLRTDPTDPWRDDPERRLVREIELPGERLVDVDVTVRVDRRAGDAELAALFGWPVVASSRLAGQPRHAGVAALDGDPTTSWVSATGDGVGATLTVRGVAEPIDRLGIAQPEGPYSRISAVVVRVGDEQRQLAVSGSGDAIAVDPPLPPGDVEITVTAVEPATARDRRFGDVVELPVAIAELELPGAPAVTGVSGSWAASFCAALLTVDGEPLGVTVTVEGDGWLDGHPVAAEVCDPRLTLAAGPHLVESVTTGSALVVDRVVLSDRVGRPVVAAGDGPTAAVAERGRFHRTVVVRGCTDGCWLVLGEGHNEAWQASVGDRSLGEPELIDGGFNGWWLEPSDTPVVVELRWTAQWGFTLAAIASLAVVAACVALIAVGVATRRRTVEPGAHVGAATHPAPALLTELPALTIRGALVTAVLWSALAGLLIAPAWALVGALAGTGVVVARRSRLPELTALATLVTVAAAVIWLERIDAPLPNGLWPARFERLHDWAMFAVAAVLCGALMASDAAPSDGTTGGGSDGDPAGQPGG